jgi:hypothetical protein
VIVVIVWLVLAVIVGVAASSRVSMTRMLLTCHIGDFCWFAERRQRSNVN